MTTKEFIQYTSERPELCEKMSHCTKPEEAYAIAREQGVAEDFDAFVKVMTETKAEIDNLRDADLANVVAAGTGTSICTVTVTVVATGAASALV